MTKYGLVETTFIYSLHLFDIVILLLVKYVQKAESVREASVLFLRTYTRFVQIVSGLEL